MRMTLHEVALPLRHPFTIAHGSQVLQRNLIVELEDDGLVGYGEGAEMAYYGQTATRMAAALEGVRPLVEGARWQRPEELWAALAPVLDQERFALCALDQAAHDLWGHRHGLPVYRLWGLTLAHCPLSNYTIGIDPVEKMVAKMQEFPGWPIYKIKLGTPHDLEIVAELRRHTPAVFRVDANTAWTVEQTLAYAPRLAELGVEFIEQPLPADHWPGLARLARESPLPILADESCQVEPDVDRCAPCFHGINIKLTKAGGLTPARRMIERARQHGLQVMVGCMTESTVGISAIAQLLPLLDYVDMDGALLLARDCATGVQVECGRAVFPDRPGTGAQLLPG
jgi:L-alanine-DL-glutamate epimerase-like enolase superfamily enzyme